MQLQSPEGISRPVPGSIDRANYIRGYFSCKIFFLPSLAGAGGLICGPKTESTSS